MKSEAFFHLSGFCVDVFDEASCASGAVTTVVIIFDEINSNGLCI